MGVTPTHSAAFLKSLLITGTIAGTMDITAASLYTCIASGRSPVIVLQYVASAVLGPESFTMGATSAVIGLVMHYFIAFLWTALFFVVASKFPGSWWLYKVTIGIGYGALVWLLMNLVILNFTWVKRGPLQLTNVLVNMLILMICIGLPIAWGAARYYGKKENSD